MFSQTTEFFNDATTTLSPIMESTTTETPLTTLATFLYDIVGNAPKTTELLMSPTSSTYQREHSEHNKITFEIPNHKDLEHIDSIHNFNTLLKRIGNAVTTYDASQFNGNSHLHQQQHHVQQAQQQLLTNAEISKSVVLDLADLKGNNDAGFGFDFGLERYFAGTDMHAIINYLWIGVVTSLIILSIIFIVFSCYFYRKFREWKKCNKDIRAHLSENNNNNNNNIDEILCTYGTTTTATTPRTYLAQMPEGNERVGYYQMESPPCYTIATGLPSYDEALMHYHHHQHHQIHHQQNFFNYAFKYMYSMPTAAHQIQHQHEEQQQSNDIVSHVNVLQADHIVDGNFFRNCKKATTNDVDNKMLQQFCNTFIVDGKNHNYKKSSSSSLSFSTLPPAYTHTHAGMSMLPLLYSNNDVIESTPMLLNVDESNECNNAINICIPTDETQIIVAPIEQLNTPEGSNVCLNMTTACDNVPTIFSQTNEADIDDDSLENITVVVA